MSAVVGLAPAATVPASAPTSSVVASAHPAPYGWQTHVVRPGDTLSDLALAHRTTVGTLLASQPAARWRLVPAPGPAPVGAAHRVVAVQVAARRGAALDDVHRPPGDTVGAIALRLGVSESRHAVRQRAATAAH